MTDQAYTAARPDLVPVPQQTDMPRIRGNVLRMIELQAAADEIDAYLAREGWTPSEFRAANITDAPPPSPPVSMANELRAQPAGINSSLARLAGAPVDVINALPMLGNLLPGEQGIGPISENPILGSQWIGDRLGDVGIDTTTQATTPLGRISARALGEAAAAIGGMGLGRGVQALNDARRIALGPTGQAVTSALTSNPVAQTAISGAAGAGAGVAGEMFPGNRWAELAGLLAGGGAGIGAAVGTRYLTDVGGAMMAPLSDAGRGRIVGRTVERLSADPNSLAYLLSGADEMVPGSMPTTAQASGDIGLLSAERGLINMGEPYASAFAGREAEQNAARLGALEGAFPGPDSAPAVAGVVQNRVAELRGGMDAEVQAALEATQQRLAELGPGLTPEAAGAILREEYNSALQQARRGVSRAYQAADPEGATQIPLAPATEFATAEIARLYGAGAGEPPAGILAIIAELEAAGPSAPLEFFQNIRSRALEIASEAGRAGRNREAAAATAIGNGVLNSVEGAIDTIPGITQEQAGLWGAARDARRDMGARFERGAAGQVGATRGYGEPARTASEVPALFFNSSRGAPDDAAQFIAAMGDRPRAVEALGDYVANSIRTAAVNADGTINAARWTRWMDQHAGALRQFPEIRQRLETVGGAQQLVDDIVGRQTRTLGEIESGALGLFMREDPERAIRSLFSGGNPEQRMRELVGSIGNDETAMAGLRRAIIEYGVPQTREGFQSTSTTALGDPRITPAAFFRFLNDNRLVLRHAFRNDHLQMLDRIANDLQGTAVASANAGRPAGTNTIQNLSIANVIGQMTQGLLDTTNPIARTITGPLQWIYTKAGAEQNIRELLRDAMLDPGLAQALVSRATLPNVDRLSRLLAERGFTTGAVGSTEALEDWRSDAPPAFGWTLVPRSAP